MFLLAINLLLLPRENLSIEVSKGVRQSPDFFFIHESCFGNIKRGPFISEAEKHIKPICFRNFLTSKLCYQGHIFHFSIRLLRQSSDFFFHFEKMVWSDFFYYEKKWNHEKNPFKSIIFFTFEPLISHRLSLAFCHIYNWCQDLSFLRKLRPCKSC